MFNLSALAGAEKPKTFTIADEGVYLGSISDCEVKESQAGRSYIKYRINLTDVDGNKKGVLFEMLHPESESNFCAYRIKVLLEALGYDLTELTDSMSCADLIDLIDKRDVTVFVKHVPDEYKISKGQKDAVKLDLDDNYNYFAAADDYDTWYGNLNGGAENTASDETDFITVDEDGELPFI